MSLVTKPLRRGIYYENRICRTYRYPILAIGDRTENGVLYCPVIHFLKEQNLQKPDRVLELSSLFEYFARNGPPKNASKWKLVEKTDRIWEFKEYQYRVLCFWIENNTVICTNALIKKGDNLPPAAIESAREWKQAYSKAQANLTLCHEPENC